MSEHYVYASEVELPPDGEGQMPLFLLEEELSEIAGDYLADAEVPTGIPYPSISKIRRGKRLAAISQN